MEITLNKYNNGKIYKITNNINNECYIGSTCQELIKRLYDHKRLYKLWLIDNLKNPFIASYILFNSYLLQNCKIELLENYPCLNKQELFLREGYYVKLLNTINKNIPGRTKKEYSLNNKDKIAEQQKIYQINNKDKIAEQAKQYRIINKDTIAEQSKQYRINNKDTIDNYFIINKDKIAEQAKQYRINNKHKIAEQKLNYRINNKDKIKKIRRDYYFKNKDKDKDKDRLIELNTEQQII